MPRILHNTASGLLNAIVRAESAVLERPAGSLDGVGVPIVVASHRRSGTHLTLDLLRRNFPACRPRMLPLENPHHAYFNIDRFEADTTMPCTEAEALRILSKAGRPSVKTHAEPAFADVPASHAAFVRALFERSRAIYVWRDGKKVMCSMWTWRRVFDPAARVPFGEFLRQTDAGGRSRPRAWAEHVAAWRAMDGVLSIEFERIVKDTRALLEEIGAFIGETPVIADPPLPRSNTTRLESYVSRLTGNLTSTNQHAAGDRPPRPEDVFSDEDLAFFEREAARAG
ncbi:MAG: sulfotransferase domain-containing protein [Phycisphaeraceae bacterium]|nr:MAG: sulfotransferase domain-containing protein [Phycisphaeraceae bacterium]